VIPTVDDFVDGRDFSTHDRQLPLSSTSDVPVRRNFATIRHEFPDLAFSSVSSISL